jgi:hypothetical protein
MPSAGISHRFALLAGAASLLAACHGREVELTSVSPREISARGGETLTLRGSGFGEGAAVRLGGERVKTVKVVSEEEIQLSTPPLYAGPLTVAVETVDGQSAELKVDVQPLDLRFSEAPPFALSWDLETPISAVALGDFDRDGDPDLVTCAAGASCRLLRNDGRGNFADTPEGKSGPRFPAAMLDTRVITAADFDGDGALDLFLGLGSEGPGAVYRNNGAATFTDAGPDTFAALVDPVTAVAAGDLDGDGRPDLVIADGTADTVPLRVYLNRSKGGAIAFSLAESWSIPERDWIVSAMTLVDVDGDGALDLVLATPSASDGVGLRLLLHHGKGFEDATARLPSGIAGEIAAIAAGDVNGDGAPDLVAVGAGQDRLLLNDGSGHFFDATLASMPLDAAPGTSVALVDLNRDRHPDLVIGNAGAETRLYLNDGTGRFLDHTPLLPIQADQTLWVAATNVDGDADEDLLILNSPPAAPRLYLSVEPSSHDAP